MLGRRSAARTLLAGLAAALAVVMFTPAPPADAATLGQQATSWAAAQKGKPYRYGAVGPSSFDCSGLVVYVYNTKLHQRLPRTATAQRKATVHIKKTSIHPGDLVFFAPSLHLARHPCRRLCRRRQDLARAQAGGRGEAVDAVDHVLECGPGHLAGGAGLGQAGTTSTAGGVLSCVLTAASHSPRNAPRSISSDGVRGAKSVSTLERTR